MMFSQPIFCKGELFNIFSIVQSAFLKIRNVVIYIVAQVGKILGNPSSKNFLHYLEMNWPIASNPINENALLILWITLFPTFDVRILYNYYFAGVFELIFNSIIGCCNINENLYSVYFISSNILFNFLNYRQSK